MRQELNGLVLRALLNLGYTQTDADVMSRSVPAQSTHMPAAENCAICAPLSCACLLLPRGGATRSQRCGGEWEISL